MNLFFRLIAVSPDFVIDALCFILKQLAGVFAQRDRRVFFNNVNRIYQLPKHSFFAKEFFQQNLHHTVRCQIETIVGIYNPARLTVEGLSELRQKAAVLLEQNKGLIVITAHLGSWEFVAKFTGEVMGRKFYALAKPAPMAFLTRFLENMRQRMGTEVLWTGRSSLLKDMVRTLKTGEILGFVMDQKPANRKGPTVDFLGQPTEFVTGPANLALKCQAPILGVYCTRLGPWRFRMQAQELYNPANRPLVGSDLEQLTQVLADDLGRMIKAYPEQWTWSYKRWSDRTKPVIISQ